MINDLEPINRYNSILHYSMEYQCLIKHEKSKYFKQFFVKHARMYDQCCGFSCKVAHTSIKMSEFIPFGLS